MFHFYNQTAQFNYDIQNDEHSNAHKNNWNHRIHFWIKYTIECTYMRLKNIKKNN